LSACKNLCPKHSRCRSTASMLSRQLKICPTTAEDTDVPKNCENVVCWAEYKGRKHFLQKVLVNLCENSRSQTELIRTLLGLLQDGTGDAATIDSSFSQVSSRASKALTPVTPKSTTKLRRETHALSLLVTSNNCLPICFLTEQEVHVALHKQSAKKSKGKEKSNTSITYPIVGLLALLDPASLFKHPNLTDSITSLLALIGRPLTVLAKKLEEAKNQPAARPSQVAANKSDAPPTTLEKAPALLAHDLRMIVNILDSGERSSKHSVIAAELLERAKFLGNALLPECNPRSSQCSRVTVNNFGQIIFCFCSAKLLRILKTTEFLDAHAKKQEGIQLPLPQPTSPLTQRVVDVTSPTSVTLVQEQDDMTHIATVLLPFMESILGRGAIIGRRKWVFPIIYRVTSKSAEYNGVKQSWINEQCNYFSQKLHKAQSRQQYGNMQLNVRRPHVFEDSFHSLARRTGDELKYGKLSVRFYDEEGVYAGGVTREWLTILFKQMLDPNYALFTGSATDSKTYQPNRASAVTHDHLGFFTFCGRVIGKALYNGRVVDAYFTLAFYKQFWEFRLA
ncbi:hypothetical protein VP01_4520g1, partial [Puccinia sorghi]